VISLEFGTYSLYCNTVEWFWWDLSLSQWPTGFLHCFDAVGWVIWHVKIVLKMAYKVSSGMFSLYSHTTIYEQSDWSYTSQHIIIGSQWLLEVVSPWAMFCVVYIICCVSTILLILIFQLYDTQLLYAWLVGEGRMSGNSACHPLVGRRNEYQWKLGSKQTLCNALAPCLWSGSASWGVNRHCTMH